MICQGGGLIASVHLGCQSCWTGLQVLLGFRSDEPRQPVPAVVHNGCFVNQLLPSGKADARKASVRVCRRAADTEPSRPTVEDSRSAFIRQVQADLLDVVESRWGTYQAYRYRTPSGRFVGIIESPRVENAMYIIDAAGDDWVNVAQADKQAVRSQPEFIARVCHLGDWQGRAMQFLV